MATEEEPTQEQEDGKTPTVPAESSERPVDEARRAARQLHDEAAELERDSGWHWGPAQLNKLSELMHAVLPQLFVDVDGKGLVRGGIVDWGTIPENAGLKCSPEQVRKVWEVFMWLGTLLDSPNEEAWSQLLAQAKDSEKRERLLAAKAGRDAAWEELDKVFGLLTDTASERASMRRVVAEVERFLGYLLTWDWSAQQFESQEHMAEHLATGLIDCLAKIRNGAELLHPTSVAADLLRTRPEHKDKRGAGNLAPRGLAARLWALMEGEEPSDPHFGDALAEIKKQFNRASASEPFK